MIVGLRVGSRREFLDPIHSFSDRIFAQCGLDQEQRYWMAMAVREAVTNALLHGNCERPGTHVEVRYEVSDEEIRVTVTDEGAGFDPSELPDPIAEDQLMETRGRGVFLIRKLMDEVSYRFPEGGGTELRMVKSRRR